HVFRTVLPLLHPFIPFVTEELWEAFGFNADEEYIMRSAWPEAKSEYMIDGVIDDMGILQDVVRNLRNLRAEAHVPPQQRLASAVIRVAGETRAAKILGESLNQIENLCRVQSVALESPASVWEHGPSLSGMSGEAEVRLPVGDVLDVPKEIARLTQEIANIEKAVASSQARLGKADFVARAPAEVVEKERTKVAEGQAQIERLRANLESLSR
ncbi:MAG: class I tRNA ligase family protein, partial [Synergistaceae bacterium]|nr:class I tRNA ligase family protein [Synergistaceae bacterium]